MVRGVCAETFGVFVVFVDPGYSLREFRDDGVEEGEFRDDGVGDDGLSSVQVACSGGRGLPLRCARSNRYAPPMMAAVMTTVVPNIEAVPLSMLPLGCRGSFTAGC